VRNARARSIAAAGLACTLAVASAHAQVPENNVVENKRITREQEAVLRDSNREQIHPSGEPLKIRGLEQDGNDMRAMTSALSKSDTNVALVDMEEARQRRLALYDQGSKIQTPLSVIGTTQAREQRKFLTRRESSTDAQPEQSSGSGSAWPWVVGAVAIGAFFAWRRWRA
jgi:MYXO-CTERM domain-containing protein